MFTTPPNSASRFTRAAAELGAVGREFLGFDADSGATQPGAATVVSDAELLELMRSAGDALRAVEAVLIATAGEVAARSASADVDERLSTRLGCARPVEVVENLTKVSGQTAVRWMKIADAVRSRTSLTGESLPAKLPALADSLASGAIGVDGAAAVVRALLPSRRVLDGEHVAAADEAIALVARGGVAVPGEEADTAAEAERGIAASDGHEGAGPFLNPACADIVKVHAQAWAAAIDPDGAEPIEKQALRNRGITVSEVREGLATIHGRVLPEVAEQLLRIFDALVTPRNTGGVQFRPSDEIGNGSDGSGTGSFLGEPCDTCAADDVCRCAPARDDRTADQKRHDAFATALFTAAASRNLPTTGLAAPTLVIMVDEHDLPGTDRLGTGIYGDATNDGTVGSGNGNGNGNDTDTDTATNDNGTGNGNGNGNVPGQAPVSKHAGTAYLPLTKAVVPVGSALHSGCSGAIQRVTMRDNGEITHISSTDRIFTAHQRRAIALRDGNCIIPGCSVPAGWGEIHHVTEHANGGETHTNNGVLLCWFHHRHLEHSGWHIRMNNGTPEVQAPTWIDPTGRWRPHTTSHLRIKRNINRRT